MRILLLLLTGLAFASGAAAHEARGLPQGASTVEDHLAEGDRLRRSGDAEGARVRFEAALKQAPDLVDALRRLAALEGGAGRPLRSLALWDRTLQLRPRDLAAQAARGRILLGLGRHAEAAAQLHVVLEGRERWHPALVADRAEALALAGRVADARAQLKAGIDRLGPVPLLVRELRALQEPASP